MAAAQAHFPEGPGSQRHLEEEGAAQVPPLPLRTEITEGKSSKNEKTLLGDQISCRAFKTMIFKSTLVF